MANPNPALQAQGQQQIQDQNVQVGPEPDGFPGASGFPDSSAMTGFGSSNEVRYHVERIVPPDGHLGTHSSPFNVDILGRLYGEGTYTVTEHRTGRTPIVKPNIVIAASAGPSRYPGQEGRSRGFRHEGSYPRVRPGFQDQDQGQGHGQGQEVSRAPLDQFARHYVQPQVDQGAASAAIKTLGDLALEDKKQAERAKNLGPDTFLRDFFSSQQSRDEERRRDEEARWQRRVDEDQKKYERAIEEDQKKHERDLEKIEKESQARLQAAKQERDAMMVLEDKKMEVFKLELKMREDRMREDLARSEKATKEMQESLKGQLDEGKEILEKEHDLRLKMLEREHEFKTEMLKVQEKAIKESSQDAFIGALERLLGEVGTRVHEIVELKKLEAMSPEAQAAAIAKGAVNGNLRESPRKPAAPQEKPPVALSGSSGNGNGHGNKEAENVEQIIRESLAKPELHGIVSEWARQVKAGTSPAMFANMFIEFMRDPEDHKLRKSCSAFANFMSSRDWASMYPVLKPSLLKEEVEIFEKPEAADFYETFRACIVESVNAYWAEFMASRSEKVAVPDVAVSKEEVPAVA